ncbi:MAG: hypothetical protein R6X02_33675 [Enhygromyxa sp.]
MADDSDEHDDAEHDAVADADAIADALEDQLADAISEPARELPIALVIPAAILTGAIAAPLTPDGHSFAQLLYAAFLRSPLEGVLTLIGFGSPFCFGLITLLLAAATGKAKLSLPPAMGERLLVVNLSFLHAQLLLVAGLLFSRGQAMLPGALLGFAIVSGGFFIVHHARSSAAAGGVQETGPRGLTQRWLVRWGATMIVAICGWMRLQVLIDVRFGWAIELMLGACVMMTIRLSSGSTPAA